MDYGDGYNFMHQSKTKIKERSAQRWSKKAETCATSLSKTAVIGRASLMEGDQEILDTIPLELHMKDTSLMIGVKIIERQPLSLPRSYRRSPLLELQWAWVRKVACMRRI